MTTSVRLLLATLLALSCSTAAFALAFAPSDEKRVPPTHPQLVANNLMMIAKNGKAPPDLE